MRLGLSVGRHDAQGAGLIKSARTCSLLHMVAKTDSTTDQSADTTLITQQEVAALFRISMRTVAYWRARGILNGRKIGGVVRFKRDEVLALLDNPGTQ